MTGPLLRMCAAAAVCALALLGLGPASPGVAPLGAQPAAAQPKAADAREGVAIDSVTPWLDAKGALTITGTVYTGATELSRPVLRLGMSLRALTSPDAVEAWKSSPSSYRSLADIAPGFTPAPGKHAITATALPKSIPAHSQAPFSLTIPAAKLGLSSTDVLRSWGARGLRLTVTQGETSAAYGRRAVAFTTWYPHPKIKPTRVGLIIPATLTGFGADGAYTAEELEKAAQNGPLRTLLETVSAAPQAAVALDPRLVISISQTLEAAAAPDDSRRRTPGDDAAEPTTAALGRFWEEFRRVLAHRDIIPLPYADADLRSARAIGKARLADAARAADRQITEVIPELKGSKRLLRYAWPAAGTADRASLEAAHAAGSAGIVLSESQLPADTSYTSNARAGLSRDELGGGLPVLTTNAALSQAAREVRPRSGEELSALIATATAITAERPFDQRSVLFALPRESAQPQWASIAALAGGLPWLKAASLPQLERAAESQRQAFAPAKELPLPEHQLSRLAEAYRKIRTFDALYSDPDAARAADGRMLLTCTSTGWVRRPESLPKCVDEAQSAAAGFGSRIDIERGSTVLLVTGEKTTIPITVHNNSTRDVEFSVELRPHTAQLRAKRSAVQKLRPGEHKRFDVPVEGIANADVKSGIELVAVNGTVVPTAEDVLVRVRADWENIGIAIVGGALGIVFLVGLAVAVRRGRPKIPKSQLEAAVARAEGGE